MHLYYHDISRGSQINYLYIYNNICDKLGGARESNEASKGSSIERNWNVDLFPNPNSGDFSIVSKAEKENLQIIIYDVNGKQVLSASVATENFVYLLSLKLTNGIYFVTIKNNQNEIITKKMVVDK